MVPFDSKLDDEPYCLGNYNRFVFARLVETLLATAQY